MAAVPPPALRAALDARRLALPQRTLLRAARHGPNPSTRAGEPPLYAPEVRHLVGASRLPAGQQHEVTRDHARRSPRRASPEDQPASWRAVRLRGVGDRLVDVKAGVDGEHELPSATAANARPRRSPSRPRRPRATAAPAMGNGTPQPDEREAVRTSRGWQWRNRGWRRRAPARALQASSGRRAGTGARRARAVSAAAIRNAGQSPGSRWSTTIAAIPARSTEADRRSEPLRRGERSTLRRRARAGPARRRLRGSRAGRTARPRAPSGRARLPTALPRRDPRARGRKPRARGTPARRAPRTPRHRHGGAPAPTRRTRPTDGWPYQEALSASSGSSSSRYRPSGSSRPTSAVSTRSAARRNAAWRRPGVHGSASPRAQRSSSRQNESAATSQARSCAITRRPVSVSATVQGQHVGPTRSLRVNDAHSRILGVSGQLGRNRRRSGMPRSDDAVTVPPAAGPAAAHRASARVPGEGELARREPHRAKSRVIKDQPSRGRPEGGARGGNRRLPHSNEATPRRRTRTSSASQPQARAEAEPRRGERSPSRRPAPGADRAPCRWPRPGRACPSSGRRGARRAASSPG